MLRKFSAFTLLIFPLIYFLLAVAIKSSVVYSLFSVDPDFPYVLNGLNILTGSLPYHIDNPGTPVQIISAIVIWVVHLFRPSNGLVDDVIKNPELYVSAISFTLIALMAVMLLFAGYFIYRKSSNLLWGFFIQLAPFASVLFLKISFHVAPDIMEGFACLLFFLVLYSFLHRKKESNIIFDPYLFYFALVIGLGASIKLNFATIAIIPLIVLKGYKNKLWVILLSAVLFLIFAFPIFGRWVYFRNWVENLFVHSGIDGHGESNIINLNTFIPNLKNIFSLSGIYAQVFILLVIATFISFFKTIGKNKNYRLVFIALVIYNLLSVILVAKHFRDSYMIPDYILVIPTLLLIIQFFLNDIQKLKKWVTLVIFIGLLFYLNVKVVIPFRNSITAVTLKKERYCKTREFVKNKTIDFPLLINSGYYGCPFYEYAVFFGKVWAGGNSADLYETAYRKNYPDSYIYVDYNKQFNTLTKSFHFGYFLRNNNLLAYFSGDKSMENNLFPIMHGIDCQLFARYILRFENKETNERYFTIDNDTLSYNKPFKINCGAETKDSLSMFFVTDKGVRIGGAEYQSDNEAHSGIYSLKLEGNQRGFVTSVSSVKHHEKYKFCVWKFDNGNNDAGICISTVDRTNSLNIFESKPKRKNGNWSLLEVEIAIKPETDFQTIQIYCINKNSNIPAFFDDLSVEKIVD